MPHEKCLEPAGRWLMTLYSKTVFHVVYVKGILGKKCDAVKKILIIMNFND